MAATARKSEAFLNVRMPDNLHIEAHLQRGACHRLSLREAVEDAAGPFAALLLQDAHRVVARAPRVHHERHRQLTCQAVFEHPDSRGALVYEPFSENGHPA